MSNFSIQEMDNSTVNKYQFVDGEQIKSTNSPVSQNRPIQRIGQKILLSTILVWQSIQPSGPVFTAPQIRFTSSIPFDENHLSDTASLTSVEITHKRNPSIAEQLISTLKRLDNLPQLVQKSENDLDKISDSTLLATSRLLENLYNLTVLNGLKWLEPHISTDGSGAVTLEWWNKNHNLSVFVYPKGNIEYLQAWGANIWNEMSEGILPTSNELIAIWKWLHE